MVSRMSRSQKERNHPESTPFSQGEKNLDSKKNIS
jgi:hypothetical protein